MKTFKYLTTLAMTAVLMTAAGCASTPTQESAGEYIDDTVITARVKTAIFADDDLKAREINVETFKGIVQLSGFVDTQAEVDKAAVIARDIGGVESVRNDIAIK